MHALLDPRIQSFIRENEGADVAALALKKPPVKDWPYPQILAQIKARQKAKTKMPAWLTVAGLVFPPPDLLEQASSAAAARYKASLAQGAVFADLTAGSGIDFAAFLENFSRGIAVEKDANAAKLLAHNLKHLAQKPFEIINAPAEDAIGNLPACDLVYLDPQRRNEGGKGLFHLEDCAPNILELLPALFEKTNAIILKASPVLDIDRAVNELGNVREVHIVEWRGECREVLYILEKNHGRPPLIIPVIIDDGGSVITKLPFTREDESAAKIEFSDPGKFLFEPSPAFQKSGAFKFIAAHYGLKKLAPHTHLYTASEHLPAFPGRVFAVTGIYPAGIKSLPVTQANLAIRNFPAETGALRRKLGLKDGGEHYLFACALNDERKVLINTLKTAPAI